MHVEVAEERAAVRRVVRAWFALLGDGMGLYFGEEDEQANEKHLCWTPDEADGTLTYSVVHPVLGWGGDEPVTAYRSPGDVVMGPFQGDWFDAARIYRRWAITAPWCAKGLIQVCPRLHWQLA